MLFKGKTFFFSSQGWSCRRPILKLHYQFWIRQLKQASSRCFCFWSTIYFLPLFGLFNRHSWTNLCSPTYLYETCFILVFSRKLLKFHSLIIRFVFVFVIFFCELSIYKDVSWFLPLMFVFIQHLNHYFVDHVLIHKQLHTEYITIP
jgi:hypothetical protein